MQLMQLVGKRFWLHLFYNPDKYYTNLIIIVLFNKNKDTNLKVI